MPIWRYRAGLFFGVAAGLISAANAVAKDAPLPPYLGFLSHVMNVKVVDHEDWTEYPFPVGTLGADTPKQGKHWHIYGIVNGDSSDKHVTWATLKTGFVASGWEVVKEFDTQPLRSILHFNKNGLDVWADVGIGSPPAENMEILEVAPIPIALTLASPAPTPEKVAPDKGNFPYLAPLPGSTLKGGHHDPGPVYVTLPGASQAEIVATGSVNKGYRPAAGLSLLEWFDLYHDALLKAGWTIISATHSGDAGMTAHYGQNGRNIWALLHMNNDGYDFVISDEAAGGLGGDLATQCHVALTGLLFDFNKATLKPESDAVLERVRGLLVKDATLKLEVQGHTDNVGTDTYNVTLSEGRAAAVTAWLTQHGIAAGRLLSKGYGLTMPIADNRTDEGRAKNRRVEIVNRVCTPKKK